MDILQKIIAHKRKEVATASTTVAWRQLEHSPLFSRTPLSLKERLQLNSNNPHIIAEFKKQSPSKGIINAHAQVAEVVRGYWQAGAAAVSVLTDAYFFGGSNADLQAARAAVEIPVLRKDFTISEYQIIEAKALGADLILLIAAVLSPSEIRNFTRLAHHVGLEVLLEVHNSEELERSFFPEIDMVGVNNRNLKTFEVSLEVSKQLSSLIPASVPSISESGISCLSEIHHLQQFGFKGFLVGENFMKTNNPAAALAQFLQS
ncbi:MAG: indole-3-glycerol phosphate synthase TrpC [Cytophagales bacterium]|nr:indole-3-glycerol phosphate synthase TrpC [Bernardetiaceae bacterium]MDW8203594.1 indole-3-glycerol phosphate synthase TrpC [Cytophagales bacterium]